jgi:hypothetical protein
MQLAQTKTKPVVLAAMRGGAYLRLVARLLTWSRHPWGALLLIAAWASTATLAVRDVFTLDHPFRWSPLALILFIPLWIGLGFFHEVGHASAIAALVGRLPDVGVAYRRELGPYWFTSLRGLPRRDRPVMVRVLLSGYVMDALTSMGLFAAARAAAPGSIASGTLYVVHALCAVVCLLAMWPANRLTDLGQVLTLIRTLEPRRTRLATVVNGTWRSAMTLGVVWLVALFIHGDATLGLGGGAP